MATAVAPDTALRLRMYRTMVECRLFETRAQELFFEGLVRGTTHLGVGQEAVEDLIGTSLVAGANVTMNYDDASGKTTINSSGGGSGSVSDGDKGDIVVSGAGANWLFDGAVVTAAEVVDALSSL